MTWANWSTGNTSWAFGPLVPDEVLYDFGGPAIFTATIGLDRLLFYKSDEHGDGDYYIAVAIADDELAALKKGRLSVRGALSQAKCWLFDLNFDMRVQRYEQRRVEAIESMLPRSGVPLYGAFQTAPDSIQQATSPLAFKFFGDELLNGKMPFSTFRGLVVDVYDVVRRSLIPRSLSNGRDSELIDFPVQQPLFASLLIAIDHPSIDVKRLRSKDRTKGLDPDDLRAESEAEGAKFVEQVERTVDFASAGKITKTYARDNFLVLDSISQIIPAEYGDVSKLQVSSSLSGRDFFVELDREVGERIRFAHKAVRDKTITMSGVIVGMVRKSHTFILRNRFGRDVTCHIVPSIYDDMIANGDIVVGRRFQVSGDLQKRDLRDRMKVDGKPTPL